MKNITTGDIIAYLERLPADTKVRLSIKDHYSVYGYNAEFHSFSMEGGILSHQHNDGWITLRASLNEDSPMTDEEVVKYPKVTFRKATR